MKNILLASATSLALMTIPGSAWAQQTGQTTGTGATMQQDMRTGSTTMTAQQRQMVDALPADRRQSYDAMTPEMQSYYLGLDAQRQDAWWLLTAEQRSQVYGLQPAQRDAAWTSILQQVAAANAGTSGTTGSMAGDTMADGSSGAMTEGTTADTTMTDSTMTGGTMAGSGTMANSVPSTPPGTDAGGIRFVSSERVQAVPADAAPATGELPICRAGQEDNCINRFEATGRGNRPLDSYPGERRTTPRR